MSLFTQRFNLFAVPVMGVLCVSLSACFEASPSNLDGTPKPVPFKSESPADVVPPSKIKEASDLNEAAVVQLEAGQATEAIQMLEKAHALAPANVVISENMARALEVDNQLPKARDAYEALSLKGELPEDKRATYLLRAVDLNIKLAEANNDSQKWNERKVNDVLVRLSTAVEEDLYVDRVDVLRGYYNIDPKG